MPTYELALLLRQMPRNEILSTVKRAAETILDNGGLISKLENLGTKPLPYKMSVHGQVHRTGTYFLINFDSQPKLIQQLKEDYGRDIDIVRRHIFLVDDGKQEECTLDDEMLPPAYRKDVQRMMRISQRKQKPKFNHRSGFSFYPFQR